MIPHLVTASRLPRRVGAAFVAFAMIAAGAACEQVLGADFDHGSDDGGDAESGTSGGAGSDDGGSSDGVPSPLADNDDFDADGVTLAGSVFLTQGGGYPQPSAVQASFTAYAAGVSGATCAELGRPGACVVTRCTVSANEVTGGTPTYLSAGTIVVAGGSSPILLYSDATSGEYPIAHSDAGLWTGGDTLTVTASGGMFPRFDVTLKTAPSLAITSPLPPSSGPRVSHARSSDLEIDWTSVGEGTATIAVHGDDVSSPRDASVQTYQYTSATCRFQAAANVGTIPASVWSYFTGSEVQVGSTQVASVLQHNGDAVVLVETADYARLSGTSESYALPLTLTE